MRVVKKENEGLTATLNRGISELAGAYIARLDHDDVSVPTRIERQAEFLDKNPNCVAVGCLLQNITADGTPAGRVRVSRKQMRHRPIDFPPRGNLAVRTNANDTGGCIAKGWRLPAAIPGCRGS